MSEFKDQLFGIHMWNTAALKPTAKSEGCDSLLSLWDAFEKFLDIHPFMMMSVCISAVDRCDQLRGK